MMHKSTVEVFKTNIIQEEDASQISQLLNSEYPKHKINFDLEDCDKILRIEGNKIDSTQIIELLLNKGFKCYVLL